jgi:hypothetical protein
MSGGKFVMKRVFFTIVFVIGIFYFVGLDTNIEASSFEEDPGPMNEKDGEN